MSIIAQKQGSDREILRKEVGFPMARQRKVMIGNFERINVTLPEGLADRLNSFLEDVPYTDKTKTIRQAIIEFLDRHEPSEPKRHIA
ncbi:hypothetical protein P3G55_24300 [Leptospira sp. 96542]|nr:hypothetical protein [Leptospira sp. 96542]